MTRPVISVEDISKRYQLGSIGTGSFRGDLQRWWANLRGKPDPYHKIGDIPHSQIIEKTLWALKEINFSVQQGEALGIIGRNGAGKSTLLKILSRVTAPTSGEIKVKGRIASLLEVGTGFHPELTGRENIYLNGAIMGMDKAEVRRKFDQIVDFSGVEQFIDTPVKRYSSGMYVRLAFAVAAHLEPEILIVDEVLAVGDAEFQKKCLGKMGDVSSEGRTVLFVSHNMASVRALCKRIIWLDGGAIRGDDGSEATIDQYINSTPVEFQKIIPIAERKREEEAHGKNVRIVDVKVRTDSGEDENIIDSAKPLSVLVTVKCYTANTRFSLEMTISDSERNLIWMNTGVMQNLIYELPVGTHIFECHMERLNLYAGEYAINVTLSLPFQEIYDRVNRAHSLIINDFDPNGTGFNLSRRHGFGVFYVNHIWKILP